MAPPTKRSAGSGKPASTRAKKSTAPGRGAGTAKSSRRTTGTSGTRTTGRATTAPSTPPATSGQPPKPGEGDKPDLASVTAAVVRDLTAIGERDPDLAVSGLAATALTLATRMDSPLTSSTAVSMLAGQLRDTLDRLRELAPTAEEGDDLDDLAARRSARLAGSAGASA